MEKESKVVVASSFMNSDSPCSALLERLKNLRKWQDEQRKELSNLSASAPQIPVLLGNESNQGHVMDVGQGLQRTHSHASMPDVAHDNEDIETTRSVSSLSGLSHPVVFGTNIHQGGHRVLQKNSESHDDDDDDASSSHFNENYDVTSPSPGLMHDNPDENCSPLVAPPTKGKTQNEIKRTLCQNSNENVILVQEVNSGKDVKHKLLFDSKKYTADWNPRFGGDPNKKVQGLAHFITRHTGGNIEAHDYVHKLDTKDNSENVELQANRKFTFLRKGGGTARFGMKPVTLKPKKNRSDSCKPDIDHEDKSGSLDGKYSARYKNPKVIPQHYTSKAANRPVKTLLLQKGSAQGLSINTSEAVTPGNLNERSDKVDFSNLLPCSDYVQRESKPKISVSDKQVRKEQEELSAFEKLEELAEDSSFSSNSSTVVQLLQRGLRSSFSTPVRRSPLPHLKGSLPPTPHLTPISSLGDCDQRERQGVQQGASVKLTDRMEQSGIINKEGHQQPGQIPLVSISGILEQLKGLVQLEDIDQSTFSQEELKLLIESFVDLNPSLPAESVSYFENNIKYASGNPTSTPAILPEPLPTRPRVHFRPEGVEVLEYVLSDSDEDNTLTETPSIAADDTDLVTTSDLEVLTEVEVNNGTNFQNYTHNQPSNEIHSGIAQVQVENSKTSSFSPDVEGLQPMKLQFSPPRHPQNSASHYIWSIFGKGKSENKGQQHKNIHRHCEKMVSRTHTSDDDAQLPTTRNLETNALASKVSESKNHQEVETYKTLLLTKMCELEKEMEVYKKGNSKFKELQESLQSDKCQLVQERKVFEEEITGERRKLREYLDSERNALWKEKQAVKLQSPSIMSVREQSLEIVYLKEQLHDLQEETKKKETLHQFALKKLNDKIKLQEEEIRLLNTKNSTLKRIEKENFQLKHELDRLKLSKKSISNNKSGMIAAGKQKLKTKSATISSINKSLDKVALVDTTPKNTLPSKTLQRINSSERLHHLNPALQRTTSCERLHNLNNQERNFSQEKSGSTEDLLDNHRVDNESERGRVSDNVENPILIDHEEAFLVARETKKSPNSQSGIISLDCTEFCRDDGTKEIIYANGNKKEIYLSGSVVIHYYNGDRKEIHDDRTIYVYGTDLTSHTTFTDGRELLEFPNGQKETRFSDGSSEIVFSDNTCKKVFPDGTEVCNMKDGTIVKTSSNGIKVFEFISGQREVHTPEQKTREYPDGTVKILYLDGRTETRYKTGRIRMKDKEGNIVTDTHQSVQ